MSDTRTKLNEAKFFLDLMEKHYLEDPGFNYCLSAFVSAARSVLWVMQTEHKHVEGWHAWYDSKNVAPEEEGFLAGINDLRIRTVKKETPATSFKVELDIPRQNITPDLERYLADHLGQMVHVVFNLHKSPAAPATTAEGEGVSIAGATLGAMYRVVEEFPDEDILGVAKRYYSWLQALVRECEARFGA